MWVSRKERPEGYGSIMGRRRAWQRAHASTSAVERGGPLHAAMPRCVSCITQLPAPRPRGTTRSVVPTWACGAPAGAPSPTPHGPRQARGRLHMTP